MRGAPLRLTTALEPFSISCSAKSRRLADSVLRSRFIVWGGPLRASGETPGSDLLEITPGKQRVEGVPLSPDGKTLAPHLSLKIVRSARSTVTAMADDEPLNANPQ